MIVSIRKSYPGQARKVMNGIWALGQAMSTKCILVVDEDVDVQDIGDVTLKVLNNIDPERDIQFTLGPVDSLDHASRLPDFGSKMGVDATRKWPSEGFTRPWPDEIRMDEKTKAQVMKRQSAHNPMRLRSSSRSWPALSLSIDTALPRMPPNGTARTITNLVELRSTDSRGRLSPHWPAKATAPFGILIGYAGIEEYCRDRQGDEHHLYGDVPAHDGGKLS
jgi:hypothetical protein